MAQAQKTPHIHPRGHGHCVAASQAGRWQRRSRSGVEWSPPTAVRKLSAHKTQLSIATQSIRSFQPFGSILIIRQQGATSLATPSHSLSQTRMPAVTFPPPGSAFYCDPVTGCFVPVRSPPTNFNNSATESTLPKDPRLWGRDEVAYWLLNVSTVHGLPPIPLDRFLMNGKALCLMTIDMFVQRVPLGGKLLYKDFQLRLCSAMYNR